MDNAVSAVMLFAFRGNEVLLQRRQNTGYMDGFWDSGASGHVEMNESMKEAMIREAKEEIGIEINSDSLEMISVIHKGPINGGKTYVNMFFKVEEYRGVPTIMEPHKCSELKWFPLDELPEDLIYDRRLALDNYLSGLYYSEIDWDKL